MTETTRAPRPLSHPGALALEAAAKRYPETVEDLPWGERAYKVRGKKTFCFLYEREDGSFKTTLKLPFRHEEACASAYGEPAGYGLGRSGWVTLTFSADDVVDVRQISDWLDESWRAVAPKALSKAFPPPGDAAS